MGVKEERKELEMNCSEEERFMIAKEERIGNVENDGKRKDRRLEILSGNKTSFY